jgi:hypothetical protein
LEQSENVCGYGIDENDMIVEAFYSICIYQTDYGHYNSRFVEKAKYKDLAEGAWLNDDDYVTWCGCCVAKKEYRNRPGFCSSDGPIDCPIKVYFCESSRRRRIRRGLNRKAQVQYCYYNENRGSNTTRCGDPFRGLQDHQVLVGVSWRATVKASLTGPLKALWTALWRVSWRVTAKASCKHMAKHSFLYDFDKECSMENMTTEVVHLHLLLI